MSNFCQKYPVSFRDPSEKKLALHISHVCLSARLVSVKLQKVYPGLFANVLGSCSGSSALGFRVNGIKAVSV